MILFWGAVMRDRWATGSDFVELRGSREMSPRPDRATSFKRSLADLPIEKQRELIKPTRPLLDQKCVDGAESNRQGLVVENNPEGTTDHAGDGDQVVQRDAVQAKTKKAGVESFEVKWTKNTDAGPTNARLRLDYTIKFKKDDDHDPALAEFRQNVKTVVEITEGPNKGYKADTSPMHDDDYSRADDLSENQKTDVDFYSNDNPGTSPIDEKDVIDYAFTAEQMVIDTSDGDKEIAKRGPHTGTIKGKEPREYEGVPTTLS